MVRLREQKKPLENLSSLWFQFQDGAIKSSEYPVKDPSLFRVSIPRWCD